jgi:histidinol dehydrogenase
MLNWSSLTQCQQQQTLARPAIANSASLASTVNDIIAQVQSQGDSALMALTEKFDGVKLSSLALKSDALVGATQRLSENRKQAIKTAFGQIERFHQAQIASDITVETMPGVICTLKTEAIESVGLYIPAGSAPLPSTVLMLGVPAKIAGCERTVLVCPPDKNGNIADEIIYAASLCEITEIYTLGGAQAVAALALGTDTIASVNKVFGPGNRFVTEAKKQLSQSVPGFAIDMPAGPSELLVIADSTANPAFVAADLLSQAELDVQIELLSRKDIAKQALAESRLIICDSLSDAVNVSNLYGPEHLCVQTAEPQLLMKKLRNAGSIFVGNYSPESAGDYASGTNHVLPTYGYSKVVSSLSLADFSRRYTVQELTKAGLQSLASTIIEVTDAEGLDAHQRAVTIRLEDTDEASA